MKLQFMHIFYFYNKVSNQNLFDWNHIFSLLLLIYRTRLMSYAYISIALLQYGDCQLNASIQ